jgi:hypothetical protein
MMMRVFETFQLIRDLAPQVVACRAIIEIRGFATFAMRASRDLPESFFDIETIQKQTPELATYSQEYLDIITANRTWLGIKVINKLENEIVADVETKQIFDMD